MAPRKYDICTLRGAIGNATAWKSKALHASFRICRGRGVSLLASTSPNKNNNIAVGALCSFSRVQARYK